MMIIACRQFMRKYWEIVEYMQMLNSIYIFMLNELMNRRQLFSSKLDLQAPIQVMDLCSSTRIFIFFKSGSLSILSFCQSQVRECH